MGTFKIVALYLKQIKCKSPLRRSAVELAEKKTSESLNGKTKYRVNATTILNTPGCILQ